MKINNKKTKMHSEIIDKNYIKNWHEDRIDIWHLSRKLRDLSFFHCYIDLATGCRVPAVKGCAD